MLLLFADDTKVYQKIREIMMKFYYSGIQTVWCHEPKNGVVKFNVDKCKVMRVANTSQHQYVLDGAKLQEVGPTAKKGFGS